MRTKKLVLLLASAGLLLGSVVSAAAQTGSKGAANPSASDPASGDWREKAMRAKAQAPDAAPVRGRIKDPEGRADRGAGDESVGAGDLGKDRGDGGDRGGKEE
jgi:hypothetical protein